MITIRITGPQGSGKSKIAHMIHDALFALGKRVLQFDSGEIANADVKSADVLIAESNVEPPPSNLKMSGYGDDDECFGSSILDYVDNKNSIYDIDDESRLNPGEEFYVDACWYRTEKWRLVSGPTKECPDAKIVCERVEGVPLHGR